MFGYVLPVATLLASLPASLCAYNMLLKRPDYSQHFPGAGQKLWPNEQCAPCAELAPRVTQH